MELLTLPLEVLQLCLTHATTPSFLQLIATCHMLWHLAASARAVILHHLAQVPGIKLGIDDLATATPELFLTLRRRACLNLVGAHIRADRTDYAFRRSSFAASASCLGAGKPLGVALVADDAVRIYGLTPHGLRYRGETLTNPDLCISRTAIDESGDVAVLYVPSAKGRLAEDSASRGRFLLVHHKGVGGQYKPVLYRSLKGCKGYKAANMAISDRGIMALVLSCDDLSPSLADMAVVCHHLKKPTEPPGLGEAAASFFRDGMEAFSRRVVLYPSVLPKESDPPLSSTIQSRLPLALNPPPLRVAFCQSGQRLKCYAAGYPVPSFHLNIRGEAASGASAVGRVHIGNCDFLVDDPFYGQHESFDADRAGTRHCTTSYLCLGVTVSAEPLDDSRLAACIIRARSTSDHNICRHLVNLDAGFAGSVDAEVVGRLWGYRAPPTSLPGIVAYSRNAMRVAVADWNRILVWPLNGQVLIDGDTGSQYYDQIWDDSFEHHHVVLKPILLKAGSVVRQMAFGGTDDELVALTAGGLQIWNLGASGTGKRVRHLLDERVSGALG